MTYLVAYLQIKSRYKRMNDNTYMQNIANLFFKIQNVVRIVKVHSKYLVVLKLILRYPNLKAPIIKPEYGWFCLKTG